MSNPTAARIIRQTASRLAAKAIARPSTSPRQLLIPALRTTSQPTTTLQSRCFSMSRATRAGIMPESENPPPPTEEAAKVTSATEPTEVDEEEYHLHADEYMEAVHEKAEELQETREDVEVEYSAGVLSITFPPNGTYVINKQPPNKQIWLSSPLSGPKRFDWVVQGESMHQKEGSGQGEWIYLRDGTTLSGVLNKELGLLVDPHAPSLEPSTDATE